MILLTHCAGNIYIFSFTFVSQFPDDLAFFRSNYAKFLMCVCITVTATLMSKMVLMITTVRTVEVMIVTQYFNLQNPFSLIFNYSNLFFVHSSSFSSLGYSPHSPSCYCCNYWRRYLHSAKSDTATSPAP